jgi:hypothetical protein
MSGTKAPLFTHDAITFELLKPRNREVFTYGGSYANDVPPEVRSHRVDNTAYQMCALGFRSCLPYRFAR